MTDEDKKVVELFRRWALTLAVRSVLLGGATVAFVLGVAHVLAHVFAIPHAGP